MAQPPMPPYGAPMYGQPIESYLTKRNLFFLNGLGLLALWLGGVFAAFSGDANVLNLARFLVVSGGVFAAGSSVAGALGSPKTSDMQNLGLLVWAGLVLLFTVWLMIFIGSP